MNSFLATISKDVLDYLFTKYFQELSILEPSQELFLQSILIEDDDIHIEADVHVETLQ